MFVSVMMFFVCNLSSVNPLKLVSMSNQECKVRPEIVNINSHKPEFFILVLKQANAVVEIDPYAKLCIHDVVKKINIKVFNLISRTNETSMKCVNANIE